MHDDRHPITVIHSLGQLAIPVHDIFLRSAFYHLLPVDDLLVFPSSPGSGNRMVFVFQYYIRPDANRELVRATTLKKHSKLY